MRRCMPRTTILLVVLIAWMAGLSGAAMAAEAQPIMVQVLFVQNAKAVVFDKGTLTLKGVSPMTIFFSDRPVRIAGHFNTKDEFVPLWDEGKDSFLKDPPNATVSMYEKGKEQLDDVVVKLSHPRLKGEDLMYDISVIEGKPPGKVGNAPSSPTLSSSRLRRSPLQALLDGRHSGP
jgi:hypothetical protein